ncbi:helix-turn-helix domain-containing protein [Kutzneria chonburiensis]|uniref:helix-turn-helix domain-containing protein n=1 Tax=Kutzneria chonburiensis TaxID=1483604 RepID=UPI00235F3E6A|nr:helix-turn-helix domain-containing protein [Kutzneria chonburiensis]
MTPERTARADAVRNSERILSATRDVFADLGPDAPLEEVARRAGVGIRTLYRHFLQGRPAPGGRQPQRHGGPPRGHRARRG